MFTWCIFFSASIWFSNLTPPLATIATKLISGNLSLAKHHFIVTVFISLGLGPFSTFFELLNLFWGEVLTQASSCSLKLFLLIPSPLVYLTLSKARGLRQFSDLLLGPVWTLFELLDQHLNLAFILAHTVRLSISLSKDRYSARSLNFRGELASKICRWLLSFFWIRPVSFLIALLSLRSQLTRLWVLILNFIWSLKVSGRRLLSLQLVGTPGMFGGGRDFLKSSTAWCLRKSLLTQSYAVASLLWGNKKG